MAEIFGRNCVIAETVCIGEQAHIGNFRLHQRQNDHRPQCVIGSYADIKCDVRIGDHVSL